MSEYWKSIDKIYCNFCKVWYQDNKSSKDFHEKGFKHKNNVQRHISEMQRKSIQNKKDQDQYNYEMKKIEQAALSAFQKDIAKNPSLLGTTHSVTLPKIIKEKNLDESEIKANSRFGDDNNSKFRKEALDLITNNLRKKNDWFESKTVEGKIYYFNKVTSEIKWKPPKCGFIPIDEQAILLNESSVNLKNEAFSSVTTYIKHDQFGKWQQVQPKQLDLINDLQLPKVKTKKIEFSREKNTDELHEFKEKTLNTTLINFNNKAQSGFKKRKLNNNKNIRTKDEE